MKLFEIGKLISGKAAELASMPRATFLYVLARYNLPAINLQAEEIDHEGEAAKQIAPWTETFASVQHCVDYGDINVNVGTIDILLGVIYSITEPKNLLK